VLPDGVLPGQRGISKGNSQNEILKLVLITIQEGVFFAASWHLPGQSWQLINTANIHLQSIMVGLDLISQGAP
jgi:hypothetical protein